MERVEPIQPIRRVLPIRKALPDYFDLEMQQQSRQKLPLRAKKFLKNNSKPESNQQQPANEAGIGHHVDYKA